MIKTFFELLLSFTKVGVLGFGGGPAFIPLIEEEVVHQHHWLTEKEFIDALAIGYTLPGPIATKLSTYVGYKIGGIPGVIAGLIGTVLPSLLIMLIIAAVFWEFKDLDTVKGMLKGIRPAVVGMLAAVTFSLAKPSIISLPEGIIAVSCFLLMVTLKFNPALIMILSAITGIVIF